MESLPLVGEITRGFLISVLAIASVGAAVGAITGSRRAFLYSPRLTGLWALIAIFFPQEGREQPSRSTVAESALVIAIILGTVGVILGLIIRRVIRGRSAPT